MSTSSSSPSPPPQPPQSSSPPSNNLKTPKPIPWSHQETVYLIQAYQEKWYSLKRGQLKSNQWEEVAAAISARCGYQYHSPSKSAIQCRHKMEKLRRRYREEKRRIAASGRCSWQYFNLMDSLECGPLPLTARPLIPAGRGATNDDDDDEDSDDDEEEEEEEEEEEVEDDEGYGARSKSQSIDYILRKPAMVNRFARSEPGFAPRMVEPEPEPVRVNKRKREAVGEAEVAGEIKAFAERMMWMEKKRIEMAREIERGRIEMENKRMEMILESERRILGMIATSFGSSSSSAKESAMEEDQHQF